MSIRQRWEHLEPRFLHRAWLIASVCTLVVPMASMLVLGAMSTGSLAGVVGLPLTFAGSLVPLALVMWRSRRVRLVAKLRRGRVCWACGYDLRGVGDDHAIACPECGQRWSPRELRQRWWGTGRGDDDLWARGEPSADMLPP